MSKYYTNVAIHGNHILFRGVNNGKRIKSKIKYSPTLFLQSNKPSKWRSLFNEPLEPMTFDTIREARDFVKRYEEVANFQIFGNTRYEYAFIADNFRGNIDWDISDLSIVFIDIEVGSDNGFPDPYKATEPITAIGIHQLNGGTTVYGCGTYENNRDDVDYILCEDEIDLCEKFLADWTSNCPDVLTGWNIKFFDVPYLINRFTRILGEDDTKKLSPWEFISQRSSVFKGKEQTMYDISGVTVLDYLELYQWYAPGGKNIENYRLDTVASVELDERKLSFDEYDSLHQLLSTKSKNIVVDVNRKVEDMKDFEKWCFLRDKIKKELSGR